MVGFVLKGGGINTRRDIYIRKIQSYCNAIDKLVALLHSAHVWMRVVIYFTKQINGNRCYIFHYLSRSFVVIYGPFVACNWWSICMCPHVVHRHVLLEQIGWTPVHGRMKIVIKWTGNIFNPG
jgi:hypothetical protein